MATWVGDHQRTPISSTCNNKSPCISGARVLTCALIWRLSNFGCRIIGAVLIVIGLYFVLWGKSAEKKGARNLLQDQLAQGADVTRHLLGGEASAKDEEAAPAMLA